MYDLLFIISLVFLLAGIILISFAISKHSSSTINYDYSFDIDEKGIKKLPSRIYLPTPLSAKGHVKRFFSPQFNEADTKWEDCVNMADRKYSLLWNPQKDPMCPSELTYYNRNLKITDIGTCEFGRRKQGKQKWEKPWGPEKMCTRESECNICDQRSKLFQESKQCIADTDFATWTPGEGTECLKEIEED
jgi:hypothetical protein